MFHLSDSSPLDSEDELRKGKVSWRERERVLKKEGKTGENCWREISLVLGTERPPPSPFSASRTVAVKVTGSLCVCVGPKLGTEIMENKFTGFKCWRRLQDIFLIAFCSSLLHTG
jgi:hypothetical protein